MRRRVRELAHEAHELEVAEDLTRLRRSAHAADRVRSAIQPAFSRSSASRPLGVGSTTGRSEPYSSCWVPTRRAIASIAVGPNDEVS